MTMTREQRREYDEFYRKARVMLTEKLPSADEALIHILSLQTAAESLAITDPTAGAED